MAALLCSVALLGACSHHSATNDIPETTTTTRSTKKTPTYNPNAVPRISIPASGCPAATGRTVTIDVDDRGITPRCVTARMSQRLVITNTGDKFHNVTIEDLSANLDIGDSQPYGRIGRYFIPGQYLIRSQTEQDMSVFPDFQATLVVVK